MSAPGLLITMQRWTGETPQLQRPVRTLVRHDTHLCPRARFLDESGAEIDLTGCTVTYSLKNRQTGVLKITAADAELEDQITNTAEVFYQPVAANVDTAGNYAEEWEITYADDTKESFPSDGLPQLVRIVEDLGNA